MTQTEPGWYPDPHGVGVVRWYDGTTWTEHTAALTIPAAIPHPVTPGWFALSRAVQAALVGTIGLDVWGIITNVQTSTLLESWKADPRSADLAEAQAVDRQWMVANATLLIALLACGILFITWLYRIHRSGDLDRSVMEHKSGWAIGGWFVPVLNFWKPLQMVQDVHRGVTGTPALSRVAVIWWLLFLMTHLFQQVANRMVPGAGTSFDYSVERWIGVVNMMVIGEAFDILTAIVCVVLVGQTASAVRRRLSSAETLK